VTGWLLDQMTEAMCAPLLGDDPRPKQPKLYVYSDTEGALWHWWIAERPGGRIIAAGSAFDWPHALGNGLYALAHLTETTHA
jgi:hypothetical protein